MKKIQYSYPPSNGYGIGMILSKYFVFFMCVSDLLKKWVIRFCTTYDMQNVPYWNFESMRNPSPNKFFRTNGTYCINICIFVIRVLIFKIWKADRCEFPPCVKMKNFKFPPFEDAYINPFHVETLHCLEQIRFTVRQFSVRSSGYDMIDILFAIFLCFNFLFAIIVLIVLFSFCMFGLKHLMVLL